MSQHQARRLSTVGLDLSHLHAPSHVNWEIHAKELIMFKMLMAQALTKSCCAFAVVFPSSKFCNDVNFTPLRIKDPQR